MKNVLIHLSPSKQFDTERNILVKIQIDNSFDLGWKKEDILLVTNFPYEYNGIKALEVDSKNYCEFRPKSTNTITVPHLFDLGLINENDLYWVHDFDAYQLHPITEEEIGLNGKDLGLTTYGWSPKWCLGSFFFKYGARDVFEWLKDAIYTWKTEDERALVSLTKRNVKCINTRYKVLNITYNFGMRQVVYNYAQADKPLKVLHFHPYYVEKGLKPIDVFMYGKGGINKPLMTDRLIRIFKNHGI